MRERSSDGPPPASPRPGEAPALAGERLVLRPAGPADAARFTEILAEPEVARWWPGYDRDRVGRELIGRRDLSVFAVELGGETIGMIQWWEEADPEYRHAGVDLFLTAREHGRGLGAEAVRLMVGYLLDRRGHHRIVTDPAAANLAAVRCYRAVGFREVGVMRSYQRLPDGSHEDGLLMELVR